METLKTYIKGLLRISGTTDFDIEIETLINSAINDLKANGFKQELFENLEKIDPLIQTLISFYCKGNFGISNSDSEKYRTAYRETLIDLVLKVEYSQ